nr:hypothetical protein [Tanacetum cinerariifolium]
RGEPRHDGALGGVAVAAAAYHRDNALLGPARLVQGLEHVFERIGRMGVIYEANNSAASHRNRFEAAGRGGQARQDGERFGGVFAQQYGRA